MYDVIVKQWSRTCGNEDLGTCKIGTIRELEKEALGESTLIHSSSQCHHGLLILSTMTSISPAGSDDHPIISIVQLTIFGSMNEAYSIIFRSYLSQLPNLSRALGTMPLVKSMLIGVVRTGCLLLAENEIR
jgi:hypothetical protein